MVWSSRNLMRTLVLLVCIVVGFVGFFSLGALDVAAGTLVGKWSSRKVCQIMLGGLLMMLNMANLMTGAMLRANGVCHWSALVVKKMARMLRGLSHCLGRTILLAPAHWKSC
jgi:hypothetical protein